MLDLDADTRAALFARAAALIEAHLAEDRARPLAPTLGREGLAAMRAGLDALDFEAPTPPLEALEGAMTALRAGQVHATDPRYFGPFHPAPSAMSVVAAALVATLDPQLATHGHAPWPVEVEGRLVRAIGARFGWDEAETDGLFTSGGAESNLTALLLARAQAFPELARRGARALAEEPAMYTSTEAHPTVARAAQIAGLGAEAIRTIPVDARGRLKPDALRLALARDRAAAARPFLIVATAGTTATGAIDPLPRVADLAAEHGCWLHVDAAFGGLAALVPELRGALEGVARADSITFDPHKATAMPLGTGMLLVRHPGALERSFHARAGYMPRDGARDPYARGVPWSRRFAGLGLFLTLATAGWDGLAAALRRQVALAERLRRGLRAEGFRVLDDGPLPVVCFVDAARAGGDRARHLDGLARAVLARGAGWLSLTRLPGGGRALRACVDNHRTDEGDVDRLVGALAEARATIAEGP